MRDVVLTVFILGLLPFVFKHAYIGALMWAWISLMAPHRLTFGFAYAMPWAAIIAGTTLLAFMFSKDRRPPPRGAITVLLFLFFAWMTFTSFFAMGSSEAIWDTWLQLFKIFLMLLVTLMLIRGRKQIDYLVWVLALSVGFYGVKGGIWTVLQGGGERVWGPTGSVIAGNNELAVGLVITIPLLFYLRTTALATRKWIRYGLVFAIITCAFSIVGSHSRGAFLAVIAAAGMLSMKSRHPVVLAVIGATALLGMFAFMPEKWVARMWTIETMGEDMSAGSRLLTWQTLWNMALDRPITGAGFETALREIFDRYAPVPMLAYSPHSTYFQALGEHGFVGLGIYLLLVLVTWRRATFLATLSVRTPGMEWADPLMRMVQVSLLGFLVGGAFLNLLHWDFPYYLMGLVVLVEATFKEQAPEAFSPRSGWGQRIRKEPALPNSRPPEDPMPARPDRAHGTSRRSAMTETPSGQARR